MQHSALIFNKSLFSRYNKQIKKFKTNKKPHRYFILINILWQYFDNNLDRCISTVSDVNYVLYFS